MCFYGCSNLSYFGFAPSSSLQSIAPHAFLFCPELKSINIPASVSDLSGQAFNGSGIQSVSAISIEEGNINLKIAGDCIVDISGVRLISYFGSSSDVTLSGDIEILGVGSCQNAAFRELRFERGSKLSRILDEAFWACKFLRSIIIPASVTTISGQAFPWNRHGWIQSISVEEGSSHFGVIDHFLLDFSGKSLIHYFGSGPSVCVLRQIEVLNDYCFAHHGELYELDFESGSLLTEIRGYVFSDCTKLRRIIIPAKVQTIDGSAFADSGIRSIEVSKNSSSFRIENHCLLDSRGGLTHYFGPKSISTYDEEISACLGWTQGMGESEPDISVTASREITALRRNCFANCTKILDLHFESRSTLVELEEFVFESCTGLQLIELPASLEVVHGSAFVGATIAKISVDPNNRYLRVIGDFLIDITRSRLIRYFGSSHLIIGNQSFPTHSSSAIILSRSVEIIGSYCFADCRTLMNLNFESGSKLTRIGRLAFQNCSLLRSIVIPASVTTICGGAFAESRIRHISRHAPPFRLPWAGCPLHSSHSLSLWSISSSLPESRFIPRASRFALWVKSSCLSHTRMDQLSFISLRGRIISFVQLVYQTTCDILLRPSYGN
jgi:hypothetical protein